MVYAQNIIVNYVIELFEATDLLQLNIIIHMTVWFRFMVFNANFNNISDCSFGIFKLFFRYIVATSLIGGGNRSIRRKPRSCRK